MILPPDVESWEGSSNPLKRKSGDRPGARQLLRIDFDGRVEERRSRAVPQPGTAPVNSRKNQTGTTCNKGARVR
jgi:hypothetical protein